MRFTMRFLEMKLPRAHILLVRSSVALVAIGPAVAQAQTAEALVSTTCGTENLLAGKTPSDAQGLQGSAVLVTDGAVAQEGAQWNAPAAVTFDTGAGQITYDFGQPQSVVALYLQADANDSYKVMGSSDGTAGNYELLVEIENVVDRGHGLRARSVQIAPARVRTLRVEMGQGDGLYSLSELAAYCRAPTPFPPQLRVVDAPPAQATGRSASEIDAEQGNASPHFALLVAAAGLALLGFGLARAGRQNADHEAQPGRWPAHDVLRVMFLASGCAALIYEIVWLHLLRLVIGASALSVGIVLAGFMGGMCLGSLLFARVVSRARNPLRVYAALEIGIGVFGLLMPLVLPAVRFVYVGLVGYGALGIALRAAIAAVLLLPPTALMGATLPAIARRYRAGRHGMSGLAALYAANTVGAVIGSLLCAFYLLAVWDVWVATLFAAALNFAVGWSAWRLARVTPGEAAPSAVAPPQAILHGTSEAKVVYLAAAFSGMTALGAQVVWTRLLTLLFGATVYAFAIILAVFLAGLGTGSVYASHLLRRGKNPLHALAFTQVALVPALLLAAWLLAQVLPYASPPASTPVTALHALHVLRAMGVIFPAAMLWGMSFPFALAAAGSRHGDTGRSSGYVYAANTVGAIVGALTTSFLAIPISGTRRAQQILVVLAAVSAAALSHAIRRSRGKGSMTGDRSLPWLSPSSALVLGVLAAAVLPGLSTAFQAHGRYIWWVDSRDQYPYVSEGAASTVAVHIAPSGTRNFHVSGRVEASSNPNDMRLQRLLGHLSALAHPRPESVLVVGLGAGVTAGALTLHPEVKRIVICEIEPRVAGAANQFGRENYQVLADPRVQMVFDDARHFLATTRERFDVITSDPIHPWVRGNSVLFSREYYAIVGARLKPHGIATQWVPLYETDEEAIRIQMQTFTNAFPSATVWNSASSGKGYDVVLLGSALPLRLDLGAIQKRMDGRPQIGASLREVKIGSAVDLVATYATSGHDMRSWLADTPVNRDFSLKLEYISGLALNRKQADPIYSHMVAGRSYPETLFAAPPEMDAELRRRLRANAATRRSPP